MWRLATIVLVLLAACSGEPKASPDQLTDWLEQEGRYSPYEAGCIAEGMVALGLTREEAAEFGVVEFPSRLDVFYEAHTICDPVMFP